MGTGKATSSAPRVSGRMRGRNKKKSPSRGRSHARGTEAWAEGVVGVGELHMSGDAGERHGSRTQPSEGGSCWEMSFRRETCPLHRERE